MWVPSWLKIQMKENFLGKTYAGTFLLGVSNFNFQYSSILNGHLLQHVWLSVNYQHSFSFFFFFWNLVMFWRCIYHICYCFPHRTNCCIGQHNHHSFLAAIITFVVTGLWGVYLSFFTICTSKDNSIFHVDCSDVYANSR